MRMWSIVGAAVALQMILVAPVTAQASAPLTGKAAIRAVIGNTVEIADGGRQNAIYFSPDGKARSTVEAASPDGKVGHWSVGAGGQLCVVDPGKTPQPNDCVDLTVDGNTVTLRIGTQRMSGTLVKGNPRGL